MPGVGPYGLEFARVRLFVANFAKSWQFYRDRLGLEPVRGHGEPPYGEFWWGKNAIIALFDRRRMAEAVGLSTGRRLARSIGGSALIFEVKDVDDVARRLRRHHVRLLRGPTDRPAWGIRTVHLRDPDGYLIEIYSGLRSK